MTHTKQWSVGDTYSDSQFPTGVAEIGDGTGYVVALVPLHQGSSRNAGRDQMLNLIAAAPELLKMLRDIVERYSQLNGRDCTHHDFACCIDSADAVIAKATGGAK